MNAFKAVLRPVGGLPNTINALLDVYLALYDTLNDDDEEVRDLGADVVSWIISTTPLHYPSQSYVPLAASPQFSKFLAKSYSRSSNLFIRAIQRFTGQLEDRGHLSIVTKGYNAPTAIKLPPVHDLLISARIEDTSLFVQEKQNLFVDEVREAEIWSVALVLLSAAACDESIAADFLSWVIEGIATLTETAKSEIDGPLGWTSKPEVFTLGLRVIFGAGVLLRWEKAGIINGSGGSVLVGLEALKEAGRKTLLHEMWIDRIEQVLARTT